MNNFVVIFCLLIVYIDVNVLSINKIKQFNFINNQLHDI